MTDLVRVIGETADPDASDLSAREMLAYGLGRSWPRSERIISVIASRVADHLLSDEAVERGAAAGFAAWYGGNRKSIEEFPEVLGMWRAAARAVLRAALGVGEEPSPKASD